MPAVFTSLSAPAVLSDGRVAFITPSSGPMLVENPGGVLTIVAQASALGGRYPNLNEFSKVTSDDTTAALIAGIDSQPTGGAFTTGIYLANAATPTPVATKVSFSYLFSQWSARADSVVASFYTSDPAHPPTPVTSEMDYYNGGGITPIATASSAGTAPFLNFVGNAALDPTGTQVTFAAAVPPKSATPSVGIFRWQAGALSTLLPASTTFNGAAIVISSIAQSDAGDIAVSDSVSGQIVLWQPSGLSQLVPPDAKASDGGAVTAAATAPKPILLRLDGQYVYFLGTRTDSSTVIPQYLQDVVFRASRTTGEIERYFDPGRVFSNWSRLNFSGITLNGTGPTLAVLVTERLGAQQAIYSGSGPFVAATFPAVPAGYPSLTLTDPSQHSAEVAAGAAYSLSVAVSSPGPVTYAWSVNGTPIDPSSPLYTGATTAQLGFAPYAQSYQSGTYTVAVTNVAGTSYGTATVTVSSTNGQDGVGSPRLTNCSILGTTGVGENAFAGGITLLPPLLQYGFSAAGGPFETFQSGTTKGLLIRAVGPGLNPFGVAGAPATQLDLYSGTTEIAANDGGWNSNPQVAAVSATVGAFPLAPGSADSALLVNVTPQSYSAVVSAPQGNGPALLEFYETDQVGNIRNLSARDLVSSTQTLTLGFVIAPTTGTSSRRVVLRAVGPGLSAFGISNPLAQPTLSLYSGGTLLAQNTGYATAPNAAQINPIASTFGAFPLAAGSADSAIMLDLPSGAYTAVVTAPANTSGVALLELYTTVGF